MRLYSIGTCAVLGAVLAAPKLCGVAELGGLIYGESQTHNVFIDGKNQSSNGVFVIPIPMEGVQKITLSFCDITNSKNCQSFDYPIKQRKYPEQTITVESKFVEYPKEIADKIATDAAEIKSTRAANSGKLYFMDMKYPFPKEYRNSGVFGSRRVFNGKPKSPHKGFDIAAPRGTIFYPVADGKVALTIDSYLNGKMILIDHGYGIYSAYLHSDEMMVKTGDTVSTKTPIGKVGSTGRSSGPHLHLGIYKNDMALNPEFFIK